GDRGQDVQVLVVDAGDADDELDLLATPIDALGVSDDRNRRVLDVALGGVGAVRDGEEAAHVSGDGFLTLVHGVDVAHVHCTSVQQELAGLVDGRVAVLGAAVQDHAFGQQDVLCRGGRSGSTGTGGRPCSGN